MLILIHNFWSLKFQALDEFDSFLETRDTFKLNLKLFPIESLIYINLFPSLPLVTKSFVAWKCNYALRLVLFFSKFQIVEKQRTIESRLTIGVDIRDSPTGNIVHHDMFVNLQPQSQHRNVTSETEHPQLITNLTVLTRPEGNLNVVVFFSLQRTRVKI